MNSFSLSTENFGENAKNILNALSVAVTDLGNFLASGLKAGVLR
jgi:hypothetical protein